ncbi:MAG: MerR family transcriptional regulator [Alphaproteobacteria bacterium]|nr:MerR family transcriptional regulator [Alphaproteobacteria bacterium]
MSEPSRIEKAPDAFRTISEVSEALDVPQHVLRFWEAKFTQIKPLKRAGGRRYYRPDDIDLLKGIRALLYNEGLTIKGVQKVLREQGAKQVAEIGRVGAKAATAKRDLAPEEVAPMPEPLFGRATPSVEHVNLSADNPSEKLLAEQRERLENVLDDLLGLRDLLNRGPRKTNKAVAAQ